MSEWHVSPLACPKAGDLPAVPWEFLVALAPGILSLLLCLVCSVQWRERVSRIVAWYMRPASLEVVLDASIHCAILAPAVLTFLQGCSWMGVARLWTLVWTMAALAAAYCAALLHHQVVHGVRPVLRLRRGLKVAWLDLVARNPVTLEVLQLAFLQLAFVLPAAYLVWDHTSYEWVRAGVAAWVWSGFLWAGFLLADARRAASHRAVS